MINKRVLLAMTAAIGPASLLPAPLPHNRIRADRSGSSSRSWPAALSTLSRDRSGNSSPRCLGNRWSSTIWPGGGTTIALKAVATSEPDGYTLLLGSTGSLTINPILFKNIDFPGIRNLVPIGMIVTTTNLFAVRSTLPVKSIDELVAYAKSNPGKLNHGASLGVPPHLLGEFVRAKTGIEMPYSLPQHGRGDSDFLSGQIQATSESSSRHVAAYPGRRRARRSWPAPSACPSFLTPTAEEG